MTRLTRDLLQRQRGACEITTASASPGWAAPESACKGSVAPARSRRTVRVLALQQHAALQRQRGACEITTNTSPSLTHRYQNACKGSVAPARSRRGDVAASHTALQPRECSSGLHGPAKAAWRLRDHDVPSALLLPSRNQGSVAPTRSRRSTSRCGRTGEGQQRQRGAYEITTDLAMLADLESDARQRGAYEITTTCMALAEKAAWRLRDHDSVAPE